MGIVDKVRDFFAPQEDDGYESEPVAEHTGSKASKERSARSESYSYEPERTLTAPAKEHTEKTETSAASSKDGKGKVMNIQATAQLQVVLVKPEVFTDAKQIADHLISKKTVVLNLETASAENKRRIIDFLVGVAYANGGSLKPVANLTYIITPYNVGFIGEDLVNELEANGAIM